MWRGSPEGTDGHPVGHLVGLLPTLRYAAFVMKAYLTPTEKVELCRQLVGNVHSVVFEVKQTTILWNTTTV